MRPPGLADCSLMARLRVWLAMAAPHCDSLFVRNSIPPERLGPALSSRTWVREVVEGMSHLGEVERGREGSRLGRDSRCDSLIAAAWVLRIGEGAEEDRYCLVEEAPCRRLSSTAVVRSPALGSACLVEVLVRHTVDVGSTESIVYVAEGCAWDSVGSHLGRGHKNTAVCGHRVELGAGRVYTQGSSWALE